MTKEFDSIRSRFHQLAGNNRVSVLVTASFNLTIEFRGLRDVPDGQLRVPANGINELQHKLLSQALSGMSGVGGYPDDVLLNIVEEIATENDVLESVVASLADAIGKFENPK